MGRISFLFNLLIHGNSEEWNSTQSKFDKSRFCEHTHEHIKERFIKLTGENLRKLESFPTLFVIEQEKKESRIGYITSLKVRTDHLLINYNFYPALPPLPSGTLKQLEQSLDMDNFEIYRTHWAIKDIELFDILIKARYFTKEQVDLALAFRKKQMEPLNHNLSTIDSLNNDHVFIIHGHDNEFKNEVSDFIKELGLKPIILHEQPSRGKTIIEKIETYTNVGFAIALYTPCDVGHKNKPNLKIKMLKSRARQNVVLEHGYLMAKLERSRVVALIKEDVELPNDISGIIHIDGGSHADWKKKLREEIVTAGIKIKPNTLYMQPRRL